MGIQLIGEWWGFSTSTQVYLQDSYTSRLVSDRIPTHPDWSLAGFLHIQTDWSLAGFLHIQSGVKHL